MTQARQQVTDKTEENLPASSQIRTKPQRRRKRKRREDRPSGLSEVEKKEIAKARFRKHGWMPVKFDELRKKFPKLSRSVIQAAIREAFEERLVSLEVKENPTLPDTPTKEELGFKLVNAFNLLQPDLRLQHALVLATSAFTPDEASNRVEAHLHFQSLLGFMGSRKLSIDIQSGFILNPEGDHIAVTSGPASAALATGLEVLLPGPEELPRVDIHPLNGQIGERPEDPAAEAEGLLGLEANSIAFRLRSHFGPRSRAFDAGSVRGEIQRKLEADLGGPLEGNKAIKLAILSLGVLDETHRSYRWCVEPSGNSFLGLIDDDQRGRFIGTIRTLVDTSREVLNVERGYHPIAELFQDFFFVEPPPSWHEELVKTGRAQKLDELRELLKELRRSEKFRPLRIHSLWPNFDKVYLLAGGPGKARSLYQLLTDPTIRVNTLVTDETSAELLIGWATERAQAMREAST